MRYEIDAALDANDIQRLQVILRNPAFNLGTVDTQMAIVFMTDLNTFRTEHSGKFVDIQWSLITKYIQGNYNKYAT